MATFAKIERGVFGISKIQIQKQITTNTDRIYDIAVVYLVFQRYKFKSKSQLRFIFPKIIIMVYLVFQRYKFKSKSQPMV